VGLHRPSLKRAGAVSAANKDESKRAFSGRLSVSTGAGLFDAAQNFRSVSPVKWARQNSAERPATASNCDGSSFSPIASAKKVGAVTGATGEGNLTASSPERIPHTYRN